VGVVDPVVAWSPDVSRPRHCHRPQVSAGAGEDLRSDRVYDQNGNPVWLDTDTVYDSLGRVSLSLV
jgi:hypothetical protein